MYAFLFHEYGKKDQETLQSRRLLQGLIKKRQIEWLVGIFRLAKEKLKIELTLISAFLVSLKSVKLLCTEQRHSI